MSESRPLRLLPDAGEGTERRRDRRPWPYSVGVKGWNRVRVYHRSDSQCIQVEWFDDRGRQQRSLRTVVGEPIVDRTWARDIAERMSEAQGRRRSQIQREIDARKKEAPITLKDLTERYHESSDAKQWSKVHRTAQERFRDFWLEQLGEEMDARAIGTDEDRIKLIADAAAQEKEWSSRTRNAYIVYLRALLNYGRKQLGVLEERETITAIKIPQWKGHRTDLTYTEEEEDLLVPKLREVDVRAFLVWESYVQAGRRMNATRQLRADAVRIEKVSTSYGPVRMAIVTYPGETDKKTRGDQVVPDEEVALYGDAIEAIEELLGTPASQATGMLMPNGDLQKANPKAGPVRAKSLYGWLIDAQERAGVANVERRKYHAGKRRFSGSQDDLEAASAQSGTSGVTLRRYRPDELKKKAELAVRIDRERQKRRKKRGK